MTDSLEHVIKSAIDRGFLGAADVTIVDMQRRAVDDRSPTVVRVRWSSGGLTRIEQLVVKHVPIDVASSQQTLLAALTEHGIPAQRILLLEPASVGAYLVFQYVPGVSMTQILADASMRWELSAHGFSFSRTLAKIHNLDWRKVVPWIADPESLPEDLIDSQVATWMEEWEDRIGRCTEQYQGHAEAAMTWLDDHRPTEVSIALCHGDYRPANVIVDNDEVAAVIGWEHALVTDASYDLALLPFEISQMGLPSEDADLLSQAIFGSYLQSSSRSLGNLQFYAVARLLTAGLQAADLDDRSPGQIAAFSSDAGELFEAMRLAMAGDRKALWKR